MNSQNLLYIFERARNEELGLTLWLDGDSVDVYPWWEVRPLPGNDILVIPRHEPRAVALARKHGIAVPKVGLTPFLIDCNYVEHADTWPLKHVPTNRLKEAIDKVKTGSWSFRDLEEIAYTGGWEVD